MGPALEHLERFAQRIRILHDVVGQGIANEANEHRVVLHVEDPLATIRRSVEGELIESQVDGRVVIESGARLERTAVRGPAIIGAGARLTDCYVGPYTAIGEHCEIANAEVEHSILLEGSAIRGLEGRVESSLLGRNVKIGRDERQPKAYRFMVGDNSEIAIP